MKTKGRTAGGASRHGEGARGHGACPARVPGRAAPWAPGGRGGRPSPAAAFFSSRTGKFFRSPFLVWEMQKTHAGPYTHPVAAEQVHGGG
jgi:hypothetical protein